MKVYARDAYEHVWKRIDPKLTLTLYVEQVDTSALDAFKRSLPAHLGPKSINQHLILVRAVLRFRLETQPSQGPCRTSRWVGAKDTCQIGTPSRSGTNYSGASFASSHNWYLFYYLDGTARSAHGGRLYAIAHRQIRREPLTSSTEAVQRGTKNPEARLAPRKNDEAYVLDLTADLLAAVDQHVSGGYGGRRVSLLEDNGCFSSLHRQPQATAEARAAEAQTSICSATTKVGQRQSQ